MRCPYCNNNTISPMKKFINKNIKCSSCGKSIHFSAPMRLLLSIVFIIAIYFNNILIENPYKSITFFILLIATVFSFMIVPIDKYNY